MVISTVPPAGVALAVVGSLARRDAGPASDLDLVVAFDRGHERILRDDLTLEATFTIDFTIYPDRSVSGFSSPLAGEGAAELQACVQGILAQIPFARGPANGSVTFSVPFQFAVQR